MRRSCFGKYSARSSESVDHTGSPANTNTEAGRAKAHGGAPDLLSAQSHLHRAALGLCFSALPSASLLFPSASLAKMDAQEASFPTQGVLPKEETGAARFIKENRETQVLHPRNEILPYLRRALHPPRAHPRLLACRWGTLVAAYHVPQLIVSLLLTGSVLGRKICPGCHL